MPFVDTTPEFWDRILAINLRRLMLGRRAVAGGVERHDGVATGDQRRHEAGELDHTVP